MIFAEFSSSKNRVELTSGTLPRPSTPHRGLRHAEPDERSSNRWIHITGDVAGNGYGWR